jgi:hypothetical protein
MRKYIVFFILLVLIPANCWSQSTAIGMRIPDTTVFRDDIIDLPVYADSTLTGRNILSYSLQLNYSQYNYQVISVTTTNTISDFFGSPTVNTSVAGKISVAGAGTAPLSGRGKFIIIRLRATQSGYNEVSFSGPDYNYFNEGVPAMNFKNGNIVINNPPSISVYPDEKIIFKSDQLQFNVSGGVTPYQWFVTNSSVATIDAEGLLTGTQPGYTRVVAVDNNGVRDTTGQIEIRSFKLSVPTDLTQWQGSDIDVPVNISDVAGLNIYSGSFEISFNQNILTPLGFVQSGTLLSSWAAPVINTSEPGKLSVAFAGSVPLTGSGTLIFIKFHVSVQNNGSTQIDFVDSRFNEDLFPAFSDGNFTVKDLAVLSLTPNSASLSAGETLQLVVSGNGVEPFSWSINNTDIATIDQAGLMTAKKSGIAIVTVHDNVGAVANSGNIQVYDTRITMPDTAFCPAAGVISYPIYIKSLPAGESVFSAEGKVTFDPQYLTFQEIETVGTLTNGWTLAANPSEGQLLFAGSGTSSFNAAGILIKVKFGINPGFTPGSSAYINLENITLNEGFPLPLVDANGSFTGTVPASAGSITGVSGICQGAHGIAYSVATIPDVTGYDWTLPEGASVVSGAGTNSITVDFSESAVSGNINVSGSNSCGNGNSSPSFYVTVSALPSTAGSITGQAIVCQGLTGVTYSIESISGASTYLWTLPSGANGSSTTNSITVDFGISAVSGDITVKGQNSCGNGALSTLSVTVNALPADAGTISGSTSLCKGQTGVTYTVPEIDDATSYIWTLPSGATGTSTTNSITVDFGLSAQSGDISVKGQNSCGEGVVSTLAVVLKNLPVTAGTISGVTSVCPGQSAVTYTVPVITGATTYLWTLPSDVTGTSTTNSITVDFGVSALSGSITVKGQNSCGDGDISSLSIVVNSKPQTPVITENTAGSVLHSDAATGNQWYKDGIFIPGATSQDYNLISIGDYYVIVTINGCSSDQSNTINVITIGIEDIFEDKSLIVYPNPVSDELTIEFGCNTHKTGFEILNSAGQTVFTGTMTDKTVVHTSGFARGVYLIKFENGKSFVFRKIIKN